MFYNLGYCKGVVVNCKFTIYVKKGDIVNLNLKKRISWGVFEISEKINSSLAIKGHIKEVGTLG